MSDGGPIGYDSLIVATGTRHSYFGHDEWAKDAPGLKSIDDALEIRRRILIAFEAAEREADPERRAEWMTFVVVGGGPTGAELAGALGEIAKDTLKRDFRSIDPTQSRIILVEAMERVLPPYPKDRSASARRQLERLGVTVRTDTKVVGIDDRSVRLEVNGKEETLPARTVLWAAGVQASSFARVVAQATGAEADRNGRIVVGPDLSIPGHPEIFVVGDVASRLRRDGRPVPGVAQGAIQGGSYAAGAILRRLDGEKTKPFQYSNRGEVAIIGRLSGVTDIPLARALRPPERLHRLAALARHPHRVPHRVRQPDRRAHALGVVVRDPRPRLAPDHGRAAPAAHRGTRAAGDPEPIRTAGRGARPINGRVNPDRRPEKEDPTVTTTESPVSGTGTYAEVNGIRLYYEIHGTGRPVILLHGGLMSGEAFGPLLPALAAGHKVIVPDLQGHGRTADIDRPIDPRLMAGDIAALIGHLGLDKPDLVGYSLGGGVAFHTAVAHPELIRRLVDRLDEPHAQRDLSGDAWPASPSECGGSRVHEADADVRAVRPRGAAAGGLPPAPGQDGPGDGQGL